MNTPRPPRARAVPDPAPPPSPPRSPPQSPPRSPPESLPRTAGSRRPDPTPRPPAPAPYTQPVHPVLHGAVAGALACLVWRFDAPRRALSSAAVGGGLGLRGWVLNAQVEHDYARTDLGAHVGALARALGCASGGTGLGAAASRTAGLGVGLLTAASVRAVHPAHDDGVTVHATVGISQPLWAAAPHAAPTTAVGTINLVIQMPVTLRASALAGALITATEAKTQALFEAGVPGTGTATDAVCVLCPPGLRGERFAGPRAPWGARLARAVHAAVSAGLAPAVAAGAPSCTR